MIFQKIGIVRKRVVIYSRFRACDLYFLRSTGYSMAVKIVDQTITGER